MEATLEAILSPLGLASIGLASLLLYSLHRYFVSPYSVFSRHGIQGPTPSLFFGNYLDIRKKGVIKFIDEQFKKHGPVFGFYIGTQPRIAVADVEMLKQITVTQYDSFTDRGFLALMHVSGLFADSEDAWRQGRHALTSAFSGMKMKMMVPLIKRSSDILVERMGTIAESGESAELFRSVNNRLNREKTPTAYTSLLLRVIYQLIPNSQESYGAYALETLIATAFGRYVALQKGEANQLTKAARDLFRLYHETQVFSPNTLLLIVSNFPWLEPLVLSAIRRYKAAAARHMIQQTALALIQERMRSQQTPKVKDLLQLMIEASVEDQSNGDGPKKLTDRQIVSFSITFLLAGYDTTGNTLTFTSYLLAMNTDVQEKLQAEIDDYFEENPEAHLYEAAQKIEYLDMVICESLRLFPPLPQVHRMCSKTTTLGGVTISEGTQVVVPIDLLHHNPEHWPDPHKFDPERFTAEAKVSRPQLAHMPFGWGPRNCIGMRFALLGTKIALMEILKKFSFIRGPETEESLQVTQGLTTSALNGVHVKVAARE